MAMPWVGGGSNPHPQGEDARLGKVMLTSQSCGKGDCIEAIEQLEGLFFYLATVLWLLILSIQAVHESQQIKDNYNNRLKVKRAMKGALKNAAGELPFSELDSIDGPCGKVHGEVGSCVTETMQFLGMAENVERFMRLLAQAKIFTLNT